jgi:hypothetical protein
LFVVRVVLVVLVVMVVVVVTLGRCAWQAERAVAARKGLVPVRGHHQA